MIFGLIINDDKKRPRGGDHCSSAFEKQKIDVSFLLFESNIVNNNEHLDQKIAEKNLLQTPSYIQTAKAIGRGVTPYKVQQARMILAYGDQDLITEVRKGGKSFIIAAKEIKAKMPKKVKSRRRMSYKRLDKEIDKLIDNCVYSGKTESEIEQRIKERFKLKAEIIEALGASK